MKPLAIPRMLSVDWTSLHVAASLARDPRALVLDRSRLVFEVLENVALHRPGGTGARGAC
jgi:hypothetical protein